MVTVSCGGNILVNVGPDKTGMIQPIFAERLRDMGKWLSVNGQAIYESQPWIYQNDTVTPNVWFTASSAPVTQRRNIYAIVLDYPYDSEDVELFSLFGKTDENTTISLLGYPHALQVSFYFFFFVILCIQNGISKFYQFSGALPTSQLLLHFPIRLN